MAKGPTRNYDLGTKYQKTREEKLRTKALASRVTGGSRGTTYRGKKLPKSQFKSAKRLKRRRKNLASLSLGGMLKNTEKQLANRIMSPIVGAPERIKNALFYGSGVADVFVPFQNMMYMMETIHAFDSANFKDRENEDDDEEDEDDDTPYWLDDEEECAEAEAEEEFPFWDGEPVKDSLAQKSPFKQYADGVFQRINKIIKNLEIIYGTKPYRLDSIRQTMRLPLQPTSENGDRSIADNIVSMLGLAAAAISGLVIGSVNSFFDEGGEQGGSIINALRSGAEIGIGALAGGQFGNLLRDMRRNRQRQDARRTRQQQRRADMRERLARGRGGSRMLRNMVRRVRNVVGPVARTVMRFGRGLSSVFRFLSRLARVGGIAGALAIPIIEWIEGSERLRELAAGYNDGTFRPDLSPEERERAHAIAESRIVVEGVSDTIGIAGGAAIGGFVGSIVPVAGTLLVGAAGAWLGEKMANWFNRHHAEGLATAIVDSGAHAGITSFGNALANFNLSEFLETALRAAPLAFPIVGPLLLALRGTELVANQLSGVSRQTMAPQQAPAEMASNISESQTPSAPPEGSSSGQQTTRSSNLNTPTRDTTHTVVMFKETIQKDVHHLVTRIGMR